MSDKKKIVLTEHQLGVIYRNTNRIKEIIDSVERRCQRTDGPVTETADEMEPSEINRIVQAIKNIAAVEKELSQ